MKTLKNVLPGSGYDPIDRTYRFRATERTYGDGERRSVDLWCYMGRGRPRSGKKDCATACAKAERDCIVAAKGNVYLTSGLEDHKPARDLAHREDE